MEGDNERGVLTMGMHTHPFLSIPHIIIITCTHSSMNGMHSMQ